MSGAKKSLTELVRSRSDVYSPKQRILADFMLKNYQDLGYSTVTDLATRAQVSDTTVVRFYQALGYKNFSEFMSDLRAEIETKRRNEIKGVSLPQYDSGASFEFPQDAYRAIFSLERAVLDETLNRINHEDFQLAVNKIHDASEFLIVASGANTCMTQACAYAFGVLRPNVSIIENYSLDTKRILDGLSTNTTCLVFSTPRYPNSTQAVLEQICRLENKPFIIGMTDSALSPIVPFSNIVFEVPERFFTFIDTNAAYMALIHSLAFGILLNYPEDSKKRIEEYDNYVKKDKYYVRDFLQLLDL